MKTETKLVKSQKKTFSKVFQEDGKYYLITAKLRHDDECGNGHNTFCITGEVWEADKHGRKRGYDCITAGCIHDEIDKHFPELAHCIPFHGCTAEGPLCYIENTTYHTDQHGPNMAWVYYADVENGIREQCCKYCSISEADAICATDTKYYCKVDEKTAKMADYDAARSTAIWPEATDEQLASDNLKSLLNARLPELMERFTAMVESLGFVY